jgi:hypothetical protein
MVAVEGGKRTDFDPTKTTAFRVSNKLIGIVRKSFLVLAVKKFIREKGTNPIQLRAFRRMG